MREVRKSQNQDLRADPAWTINSGRMEFRSQRVSGPQAPEGGVKCPRYCDDQVLGPSIG